MNTVNGGKTCPQLRHRCPRDVLKSARFSLPEAASLLTGLGLVLD